MKKKGKTIFRLNTVILITVKVKLIRYVALPDRASNTLRGDVIRLGDVYVCDVTHDKIPENIFSKEESNYDEFIL